jgi:hypothetical protein
MAAAILGLSPPYSKGEAEIIRQRKKPRSFLNVAFIYAGNAMTLPALEREQQLVRTFDFIFGL